MSRGHHSPGQSEAPLLIVAHPDDETLWFEPLLNDEGTILVAFPDHPRDPAIAAARQRIRATFPIGRMVFLPLSSVDAIGQSDWRRRRPTRYGVELSSACPADVRNEYIVNYERLTGLLEPYLAEYSTVFTHNPWGEYGHEEHIQLCQAVLDVGARFGTTVWAWDGMPLKSLRRTGMRLRLDYYEAGMGRLRRQSLSVDRDRFEQLQRLYVDEGAWTWYPDYRPPDDAEYVELMHEGTALLPPIPVRRIRRDLGILTAHVLRTPIALGRLLRHGRLRG